MAQPVIIQGVKMLVFDLFGGVIGFPFWWYSRGLVKWSKFVWAWFLGYKAYLGVGVWVSNLFVPMYGSNTIAGRLISFFMRSVMIVIRSVGLLFLVLFCSALFLSYVFIPILVIVMVVYNLVGVGISFK